VQWVKRRFPMDEHKSFEETLKVLTGFMMTAGTIVMGLYWFIMDVTKKQYKALALAKAKEEGKTTIGEWV
jgi:hypothetical protein